MPASRKRVLIVTYYFPPSGGPGVQRILRIIRNIQQFGWEPIVLTVRNGDYPTKDSTLLKALPPSLPVYRTFIPEPYRLYRRFTGRDATEAVDMDPGVNSRQGVKETIALLLRDLLFIPDPRVGWLPFALWSGIKAIRKERVDLIFSSAPPNSVHLVGLLLSRMTKTPWVADFRDPWFKYLAPKRKATLPAKLDRTLGKAVLRNADHLIWVCEGVRKEMLSLSDPTTSERSTILTNGYDENDFKTVPLKRSNKFRITYVGSFFAKYDLTSFISAIQHLCARDRDFKKDLEILFCGRVDEQVSAKLIRSTFSANVKFLGYQTHSKTLALMKSSSLLLLYIIDSAHGKNIPTSKLFEYLGSGRHILALAPQDSDAAQIIAETKTGSVVSPGDSAAISIAIQGLYSEWQAGRLNAKNVGNPLRERYEIKSLAKRLTDVWNGTILK